MKTRITHKLARAFALAAAILAATPSFALAEGEEVSGGISLLLPKLAELIPASVAFLIIFLVLSKVVWPTVVKMMDDRQKAIEGELKDAEEVKEQAEEIKKQSEEVLTNARKEAEEIIAQAKEEAENERNRILVDAHAQAADTIEKGHKVIDSERQRAMDDLAKSVSDLSVEIAGKIIGSDLDDAEHRALIERMLDEMGNENGN